jgi:hypothetical protein
MSIKRKLAYRQVPLVTVRNDTLVASRLTRSPLKNLWNGTQRLDQRYTWNRVARGIASRPPHYKTTYQRLLLLLLLLPLLLLLLLVLGQLLGLLLAAVAGAAAAAAAVDVDDDEKKRRRRA